MQKVISVANFIRLALFFSLLGGLYACNLISPTNACDNVKCQHGGICIDGTCTCPYGWSGTSCEVLYDSCGVRYCNYKNTNPERCRNNTCSCRDGWGGDSCTVLLSDAYAGLYAATETTNSAILNYPSRIKPLPCDSLRLLIFIKNGTDSVRAILRKDSLFLHGNSRITEPIGTADKRFKQIRLNFKYRKVGAPVGEPVSLFFSR